LSESEILQAALRLPADRRDNFVVEKCENNHPLRDRILKKLHESHATPSDPADSKSEVDFVSFWEGEQKAESEPADEYPVSTLEFLKSGQRIGPYKLIQPIGLGGMGAVWMAEQSEPVKRRVALKLIKNWGRSKETLARFEAERQALAMMNHPNIARILDAGTTLEGQPYFAMELVSGKPLTTYCDENRLGIEERLKLFTDVCNGVQHAHQKGIIHRDLKPSNILVGQVDGKAVAKVIDFGLAKALETTHRLTDQSLFTGVGQILGTLKYMSPEQAGLDTLDIDTRTDIYALGVILYELLTGSTPLEDASVKEQAALKVLEIIREKEPVKPSSRLGSSTEDQLSSITSHRRTDTTRLKRLLIGDLDWIVMKALEKDRNRRYDTSAALADDVQRYLNEEPIEARPPSFQYQLGKYVRKHKGFFVAVSAIVFALAVGFSGTLLGLLKANVSAAAAKQSEEAERQAKEEALSQKAIAERQKQEAESQKSLAQNAQLEAESATREAELVSLHAQAETALALRQFHHAFGFNRQLVEKSDHWAYGFQTTRILNEISLQQKLLAVTDTPFEPPWAKICHSEYIVFQETSFDVKVFSLKSNKVVAEKQMGSLWKYVTTWDRSHVIAIIDGMLTRVNLVTLEEAGSTSLAASDGDNVDWQPIQVSKSSNRQRIAVLTSDGRVMVFEGESLKKIASAQIPNFEYDPSCLDLAFSPEGEKLAVKCFQRVDWLFDIEKQIGAYSAVGPVHNLSFLDEETLFGMMYYIGVGERMRFNRAKWLDPSDLDKSSTPLPSQNLPDKDADNIMVAGDISDLCVFDHPHNAEKCVAIFFEDNVSYFPIESPQLGMSLRYDDLCPSATERVVFKDHQIEKGHICVFADQKIWLYEAKLTTDGHRQKLKTAFDRTGIRAFTVVNDHSYEFFNLQELVRIDHKTSARKQIVLQRPHSKDDLMMSAWDILLSPDGKKLLMLWQENDRYGYGDAAFYRRILALYDIANLDERERSTSEPIPIFTQINLDWWDSRRRMEGWRLSWSNDGDSIVYSSYEFARDDPTNIHKGQLRTEVYDTESGKLRFSINCGGGITHSEDGSLFATYWRNRPDIMRIFSVSSSEPIMEFAMDAGVYRVAFSNDNRYAYGGTRNGRLLTLDIESGKQTRDIASDIAPVYVFPGSTQFLGVREKTSEYGTLVASDLRHGRVTELIDNSFWSGTRVYMSEDNRTIRYASRNLAVHTIHASTLDEAFRILRTPEIELNRN